MTGGMGTSGPCPQEPFPERLHKQSLQELKGTGWIFKTAAARVQKKKYLYASLWDAEIKAEKFNFVLIWAKI